MSSILFSSVPVVSILLARLTKASSTERGVFLFEAFETVVDWLGACWLVN